MRGRRARFAVRAAGGATMHGYRRGPWHVVDMRPGLRYPPLSALEAPAVASYPTQARAQADARARNAVEGAADAPGRPRLDDPAPAAPTHTPDAAPAVRPPKRPR